MYEDRKQHIYFVIDMAGMKMERELVLNQCMKVIVDNIREEAENCSVYTDISILTYSTGCEWLCKNENAADFTMPEIQYRGGVSDLGMALVELSKEMEHFEGKCLEPLIVFIMNSGPTDDYIVGMDRLKKKPWFKYSDRIAVAFSDWADMDILKELCLNPELVIECNCESGYSTHKEQFEKTVSRIIRYTIYHELKDDGLNDGYYTDEILYAYDDGETSYEKYPFSDMDEIQRVVVSMLIKYPNTWKDARGLKSLLSDGIPNNKAHINVLVSAYQENVIQKIAEAKDINILCANMINLLIQNYGFEQSICNWAIQTWGKYCKLVGSFPKEVVSMGDIPARPGDDIW